MGFRFNTWRTDCRTPWVPEFTAKKPSREAGFSDILLLIPNKWSWTPNAWKTWVTKFAWKTWLVVSWLTLFGWSFLDKHVPRWVSVSVSCWKKIWRRCTRSHDKPVVRLFAFTILRIDQIFLTSTQLASYNKTLKNHNSSISPQIPKFQQASPEIPIKFAHNSMYNDPRYTSSKIRSKKLLPCTATEHRKSFWTMSPATTPKDAKAARRTLSTLSWLLVVVTKKLGVSQVYVVFCLPCSGVSLVETVLKSSLVLCLHYWSLLAHTTHVWYICMRLVDYCGYSSI